MKSPNFAHTYVHMVKWLVVQGLPAVALFKKYSIGKLKPGELNKSEDKFRPYVAAFVSVFYQEDKSDALSQG